MMVSPSTVWNGTDSNISSARAGYGQRPGSGSSPISGQKNRQPVDDEVHVHQLVQPGVLRVSRYRPVK